MSGWFLSSFWRMLYDLGPQSELDRRMGETYFKHAPLASFILNIVNVVTTVATFFN